MTTAPTYLIHRFFYRVIEFFRHWYIKSASFYWHFVINQLERLDYYLAWRITLKYLFQPLYKDYTLIGYILGFIFRSARLLIASIIYAVIFAVALVLYVLWLLVPVLLVYKVFGG